MRAASRDAPTAGEWAAQKERSQDSRWVDLRAAVSADWSAAPWAGARACPWVVCWAAKLAAP